MDKSMQKININDEATCDHCGARLTGLTEFSYAGDFFAYPDSREEICKCNKCGTKFILHYDLFDKDGHIYARVFTGDINNPSFNWQDSLTEEQKNAIELHLRSCPDCQERLTEEMLSDAWFASIMHEIKFKK